MVLDRLPGVWRTDGARGALYNTLITFCGHEKTSNSLSFSNDWYFTSYLQLIQLQLAETAIVNLAFDVLNNQFKSFED